MEINPIEVVVAYLREQAGLQAIVGGRIDTKHHYGSGWDRMTDASLVVQVGYGGTADTDTPTQPLPLEMLAYAPTQARAVEVWRAVVDVSRATQRELVVTTEGSGLLYNLLQESGLSLIYDPEVQMDLAACFFTARVSELAV